MLKAAETREEPMSFSILSEEAKSVAVNMIEYCLENAIGMGMDEGLTKNGKSRKFRKDLEQLVTHYKDKRYETRSQ